MSSVGRRDRRAALALTITVLGMTALLLTGCGGRSESVPAEPAASSVGSSEPSPQASSSAGANAVTSTSRSTDPAATDLQAAAEAADAIQDSVSSAEAVLKDLDQDFQEDSTATN